jgi:hypothetical protein
VSRYRNVAIVLLLALAVFALPGADTGALLIAALLSLVFAGGLAFFAGRLYLEHRVAIFGLGERNRGLLYGAFGLGVLTVAATPRLWDSGPGTLAWFALIGACSAALAIVIRDVRRY